MRAKKETKEETKEEAVERAIRYRNLAALEKLLAENPALVNSADKYGKTPLHHAASYSNVVEVAKMLLERGADVDAKSKNGWTPLHCAALYGYWGVAKALLEQGAATDVKSNKDETPLHVAAYMHNLACMIALLEAGADVNAVTTRGDTPVVLALAYIVSRRMQHPEDSVGILLAAGGSIPPGVELSNAVMAAAVAHTAIRAASLSDAAVADAERRVWLVPVAGGGYVGARPLVAATMLSDGCNERRTLTDLVMAELPRLPDVKAWRAEQQRLDGAAAAAPSASRFVPGMFVSRAAVQLAFARMRSDAVSAVRVDAAGRSIAALGEVVKMTKTSNRGRDISRSGGGGAARAYDKALYAAVRCVGRWGELCSEATAASKELALAQQQLEKARNSAEAAAAALSRQYFSQPLALT